MGGRRGAQSMPSCGSADLAWLVLRDPLQDMSGQAINHMIKGAQTLVGSIGGSAWVG